MAISVSNLPNQVTEADLSNLFAKYGNIRKIFISPPPGNATVEMEGEAEEDRALQELNHVEWLGQKLKLLKSANIDDGEGSLDQVYEFSSQETFTRDAQGGP